MDEGDVATLEAGTRLLVDQLCPSGSDALDPGRLVAARERWVMHPGAAALEDPPARRVGLESREQLDPPVPDAHQSRLHALVGERLSQLDLGPEEPSPGGDGLVEVGHGDTDVVD